MSEIDYKQKAQDLWQLLDSIDTLSDIVKPADEDSYRMFYQLAMNTCKRRFQYFVSEDGQTLMDTFKGTMVNLTIHNAVLTAQDN